MKLINKSVVETEDFLNNRLDALISLSGKFSTMMEDAHKYQEEIKILYDRMAEIAHQIRPWHKWILDYHPRMEKMLLDLYQWHGWKYRKISIKKPVRKVKMEKTPVISKALKNWDDALALGSYDQERE